MLFGGGGVVKQKKTHPTVPTVFVVYSKNLSGIEFIESKNLLINDLSNLKIKGLDQPI